MSHSNQPSKFNERTLDPHFSLLPNQATHGRGCLDLNLREWAMAVGLLVVVARR
jgi:hypothetical protein